MFAQQNRNDMKLELMEMLLLLNMDEALCKTEPFFSKHPMHTQFFPVKRKRKRGKLQGGASLFMLILKQLTIPLLRPTYSLQLTIPFLRVLACACTERGLLCFCRPVPSRTPTDTSFTWYFLAPLLRSKRRDQTRSQWTAWPNAQCAEATCACPAELIRTCWT